VNTVLATKLHRYIIDNHPDLLVELQSERNVTAYINDKLSSVDFLFNELCAAGEPAYIIEERCMEVLTYDLKPSKYNYIHQLLQEEFAEQFNTWRENGTLTYEIINLITIAQPVFTHFNFSEETKDSKELYYTITGAVSEYITRAVEKETV